jgi:lipocalin
VIVSVFEQPAAAPECQPVNTVADFDVATYISSRWYIQQQMEVSYLPLTWNYCVFAEYTQFQSPNVNGYSYGVHNYAEEVDGTVHDSNIEIPGGGICAAGADKNDPAKLKVAPCFVPKLFAGPYWILEYSEEEGYALVSGGQPTIPTTGGKCKLGNGVNNSGLWIFTRAQQRDDALVQKVRALADAQGFDVSVLNDVSQVNCAPVDGTVVA